MLGIRERVGPGSGLRAGSAELGGEAGRSARRLGDDAAVEVRVHLGQRRASWAELPCVLAGACATKGGPLFLLVELAQPHRNNENVTFSSGLVLDVDHESEAGIAAIHTELRRHGVAFLHAPTHSNAPPDDCRQRIVVPFAGELANVGAGRLLDRPSRASGYQGPGRCAGKSTPKMHPRPGTSFNRSSPPCASTARRAIESTGPKPLRLPG